MLLQQKKDNKFLIILFFSIIFHLLIIYTFHINLHHNKKIEGDFHEIEINLNDYNTISFKGEELPINNIPKIPNINVNQIENIDKNINKKFKIQKEKIEIFKNSNLSEIPKSIPTTYPSSNITKISQSFENVHSKNNNNSSSKSIENNSQEIISSYLMLINERIKRNVKYPFIAKKNGIEGKVIVQFKILKDGKVRNIKIIKSSGFDILDKYAIKAILSSVPFPHLPRNLGKNNLTIEVPINFFLED